MPPPKAKLHSKTGKLKTIPNASPPTPAPSTSSNATAEDSEAARQFEVELCWCIQQLENSLNTGKLNQKQAADVEKSLKTLKSSNQPIIKKRQLMRSTFGDYRAKMAEEEKKMSLGLKQIKFTNKAVEEKAHFVKKSAFLSSGENFKFNFPVEQIENLNISKDKDQLTENGNKQECSKETSSNSFHYTPSGNAFRFNFNIDNTAEST